MPQPTKSAKAPPTVRSWALPLWPPMAMQPTRSLTRWTTTRADGSLINASTGVVTVANNTLLDYETTTSHNITVRATSSDTSTNTAGFTINLTDDNTEFSISAVSDSDATANEVSESAANGTVVGVTALATDGDATDTITYSLDDDAGGRFAINATSGCGDRGQQHAAGLRDHDQPQHHGPGHLQRHLSTNTAGFTINLTDDNTEF